MNVNVFSILITVGTLSGVRDEDEEMLSPIIV